MNDGQDTKCVPNSLDDFEARFWALQQEAHSYGIASLVCLHDSDPLGRSDTKQLNYRGGWTLCLGLAVYAQHRLLSGDMEDEESDD